MKIIMIVDQVMLSRTSREIKTSLMTHKPVPDFLIRNWITALILVQPLNELDSDTVELIDDIKAMYTYSSKKPEGFDMGAIYGSLLYLDRFKELNLKEKTNGHAS